MGWTADEWFFCLSSLEVKNNCRSEPTFLVEAQPHRKALGYRMDCNGCKELIQDGLLVFHMDQVASVCSSEESKRHFMKRICFTQHWDRTREWKPLDHSMQILMKRRVGLGTWPVLRDSLCARHFPRLSSAPKTAGLLLSYSSIECVTG